MHHVHCQCSITKKRIESIAGTEASLRMYENNHQCITLLEHNQHNPHLMGTVVFHAHPFPTICELGKDEVSLIMESYPTSFNRCRTKNQGTFQKIQKRQSYLSSLSMGVVGNRTEHKYYNDSNTNTFLIPLTSALMNSLQQVTVSAQDASSQVFIGLIKKAFSCHYNWDKLLLSDDICPCGIMTCPIKSFCNGGHRDSTDFIG